MKLIYGKRNVISFASVEDFFIVLGYLASPNRKTYISDEKSNNRWGAEYRIWLKSIDNIPKDLNFAVSAGLNNYTARLNCNEYVVKLLQEFGFDKGSNQDYTKIRSIVETNHTEFLEKFDYGFHL